MLNPRSYFNSQPDGFGVLEVTDPPTHQKNSRRHFVPLRETNLTGSVTGPLAALRLTQTFALDLELLPRAIEAAYRFPLPGDAAVTGVRVRFGDVEIHTVLKERATAEIDYAKAKRTGRQAALVTRESPDVFTLAIAGIRTGQQVEIETEFVQLARPEAIGWSLRVPLTTAPRYVRSDEASSRHAKGQPLALLRDPGHRFTLDLLFQGTDCVTSPSHSLAVAREGTGERVQLREGEVIPNRDCVLNWQSFAEPSRPSLAVWTQADAHAGQEYFLALCAPPSNPTAEAVAREVILLVDHSGSMQGAKWEAADWAVERFLAGLTERDSFALGLFHNTTRWYARRPQFATPSNIQAAREFLNQFRDQGGTELGMALEQTLGLPRTNGNLSRHVLVITDAEVTDAGRILRLADSEALEPDRRRISVLCIDAAPNAGLVEELASRGGGTARYLTSNPEEDDITTALDDLLTEWAAPLAVGVTLEVNRLGVEAAGRSTTLIVPGPASTIDLGDLPTRHPRWIVGRVPLRPHEPLAFRLRNRADVLAEAHPGAAHASLGAKELFGANRIRRLEYVMQSGLTGDALVGELTRLGVKPESKGTVYSENNEVAAKQSLSKLLVRESLACGLPSSETAFVATRTELGRRVTETVLVANATPADVTEDYLACHRSGGVSIGSAASRRGPRGALLRKHMRPNPGGGGAGRGSPMKLTPEMMERLRTASARGQKMSLTECTRPVDIPQQAKELRITIEAGQLSAASSVLYDSATEPGASPIPETCRLTSVLLVFGKPAVSVSDLDHGLTLLVFLGDSAKPRARVRLIDLLRLGGRRPLNLQRAVGDVVRLVLDDPASSWRGNNPLMNLTLAWTE